MDICTNPKILSWCPYAENFAMSHKNDITYTVPLTILDTAVI